MTSHQINHHTREAAWDLVNRVMHEQDRGGHLSAYSACRAAGVSPADYKAARFELSGENGFGASC